MIVVGDAAGQWVAEAVNVVWHPDMTAVAWMADGELVAGILYESYTGASIGMHSRVTDPSKVTRQWLFSIFDYPFNELGCRRVTGMVPSDNLQAQQIDERLGFEFEARLTGYYPTCDALIYVMWKEDCRWLKLREKVHGRKKFPESP